MPTFDLRPPPLLLAALHLAAGIALGLRLAAAGAAAGWGGASADAPEGWSAVAFLLGLALVAAILGLAPRARSGPAAAAALLGCFLAGLGLGTRSGGSAVGSCAAALRDGERVAVTGTLEATLFPLPAAASEPAGGGAPARTVRASLRRVTLESGGRRCRLTRLGARVDPPATPLEAGRPVAIVGRWRRHGAPPEAGGARWPRPPDAYGSVRGRLEADGEEGPGAPVASAAGRRPAGALLAARAAAARRLDARLPPDVAPLGRALTLAERGELDPRMVRRFTDAGLVHLLAISGMHIGILAGGAVWLAGLLLGRRPARWPAAAGFTFLYVLAIGAPPSAVRASLLLGGYAAARVRGAPARLGDLAGAAATLALLADPSVLVRPGFQLSFAGFGGVVAGDRAARRLLARAAGQVEDPAAPGTGARGSSGPPPATRKARAARGAARALGAGSGAFLLTAPLAAAHFERVAPAAILSNLVGAPLLGLALAGLAGALLLPGPPGRLAADAAAGALRLMDRSAGLFAALPLHGRVEAPDAAGWGCLLLLLAALALLVGGRRPARALTPAAAAAALWLAAPALPTGGGGSVTLLCSLDVGQGDATALRTRRGRWILLDAGPGRGFDPEGRGPPGEAGYRVVVPFLRAHGARAVDLFVLSHPHLDHLGGAAAVFERFPVRRVLDASLPAPSRPYLAFLDAVADEGAEWLPAREGARLRIDEAEILVLGPGPLEGAVPEDLNEASVLVRLTVEGRERRFVYVNTGDAPKALERRVLERWPADSVRAQLLKLGHHGSRTSSSVAWLRAVAPEVAVISAGRGNRYGHPHAVTLARADSAGLPRLWRTDHEGTLCLEVDRRGDWRIAR